MEFARRGANLFITYRAQGAAAEEVADEIRALDTGCVTCPVDVNSSADLERRVGEARERCGGGGYLGTDSELRRVVRLDALGKPAGDFGGGVLTRPTGIARDPLTGTIYVADTGAHDIKAFDESGRLIDTVAGPGRGVGRLNTPTHMVFHEGRLYVADTLNFRVQAFNRDGTPVFDFGELGLSVGNMSRPKGVAIGGEGRIYVVESYYDYLLIFDQSGQLLLPIGGTGREVGQFYLPAGVWTDNQHRVYVADMFNGRIIVLTELTEMEARP